MPNIMLAQSITAWSNISGEAAAEEIWNWSLLGAPSETQFVFDTVTALGRCPWSPEIPRQNKAF